MTDRDYNNDIDFSETSIRSSQNADYTESDLSESDLLIRSQLQSQQNNFSLSYDNNKNNQANENDIRVEYKNISPDQLENSAVKENIKKNLKNFLKIPKIVRKIREMCTYNKESIYVKYKEIEEFNENIVNVLINNTKVFMTIFNDALKAVVSSMFSNYENIKKSVFVRIYELPFFEKIRDLRNKNLNTLIQLTGVVTRRTNVIPLMAIAKYDCLKCNCEFGPFVVDEEFRPSNCIECQSRGPFKISQNTIYKDYQKLRIQELPNSVDTGSLPRSLEVILQNDLIDTTKPGDEITITGIYQNSFNLNYNIKTGFPVFFTSLDCLCLSKKENEFKLTNDDIVKIFELSKKKNIKNIIRNSIAPSIFGHSSMKQAIACSIFGGVSKTKDDYKIRGDINVLLMGDPGTAKSQILRFVNEISSKSILASGQGASSVGLTASVKRDHMTKEWTLEGGAMVLADKGICLIDEFDKMNDKDRTSIHEAMEQQSISISKAGIVSSLNARCSVIAAANPKLGRYNTSIPFRLNVNLSDPIISRFDILCVVRDEINSEIDSMMAEYILNNRMKNLEESNNNDTSFDDPNRIEDLNLFKKYIYYAKMKINPKINASKINKMAVVYSELRKESLRNAGVHITPRWVESMVRVSESFAKMRLSEEVNDGDVDDAISVCVESFIYAQKYSVLKNLRRKFKKYLKNSDSILIYILNEMFKEVQSFSNNNFISIDIFKKRADDFGIDINDFIKEVEVKRKDTLLKATM
nr:DNA replication licensing factor MCM2-like [Lepeophtheirus salmonis]